jgi:rhodanese-related sulfurtransferase
MTEIPQRVSDIQAVLARGPLVVYCHHGVRSSQVVGWLAEQGISGILNLRGGIDAWSLKADPSVRRYHLKILTPTEEEHLLGS